MAESLLLQFSLSAQEASTPKQQGPCKLGPSHYPAGDVGLQDQQSPREPASFMLAVSTTKEENRAGVQGHLHIRKNYNQ